MSCVLFQFCFRIWKRCKILRLLVPILTYLKKKVFSAFLKNKRWSILLNSMVLSRSGEGAGDAKFLLICLALHPICLKTFVVFKVCSSIYRLYPLWECLITILKNSNLATFCSCKKFSHRKFYLCVKEKGSHSH